MKILLDVEYESDSSYQLLLRFCGLSFKLPDPFDEHRDEQAVTRRMAGVKAQVKDLLDAGWEVYAADEVRLEHEAETRRMWLPRGQRTKLYVDRQKTAQSFFGALSLTSKKWSELGFSDSGERLVQAVWLWRLGSASTSLGVR
ncbi:hypothetical protein [Propionibacterium acidifaciens]|uniref:hypothetical protein n=1 Tax=Propionibacterium acidifaciens TaxID=556499 RepID=UPI0028E2A003|nr:hypothetical protein [Propionibacterium acidifaciens]